MRSAPEMSDRLTTMFPYIAYAESYFETRAHENSGSSGQAFRERGLLSNFVSYYHTGHLTLIPTILYPRVLIRCKRTGMISLLTWTHRAVVKKSGSVPVVPCHSVRLIY